MAPKRTTKGLAAAASSGSRPQGGGRQVLRPQTLSSSSSAQNTRTGNRREAAAGTVAVQPSQTQRRSGRLAQTATSSSSSSSSSSSAASKETVKAKPKQPTSSPSSSASASTAAPSSSSAAAAVGVRVRGRDAPADRRSGRLAAVEKEKARRVKEASAAKAEEKGGKKRVEPTETEKEQQAKKRKEEGEGKGATSNGKEETDEASALSCAPIDFLSRRLFGASSRSLPIGMNGGHLPASHGHTRVGGLCDQNFRRRRAQEELKENLDAMEVLYVDRMSSEGDKVFSFRTSDRRPLVYSGGKGGTLTAYKMTADSSDDALRIYPVHQAHVTAVREVDVSGLFPLLVSSSYDGTVKVTDLQHGIAFNTLESFSGEVCKVTALDVSGDRQRIAYANDKGQMVVSAPNEAGWKGQATRMKTGLRHKVHQGKAGYLSFSPTCSHYLASGGNDGMIRMWDLRKLDDSIWDFGPVRAVKTASFDPTGTSLLCSTLDDKFYVFQEVTEVPSFKQTWKEFSKAHKEAKFSSWVATNGNSWAMAGRQGLRGCSSVAHPNQTGLWITDFEPLWHPSVGGVFVSGSLSREVQVFASPDPDSRFTTMKNLTDDDVTISSFAAFMPQYDLMVSICYGKVAFWGRPETPFPLPRHFAGDMAAL